MIRAAALCPRAGTETSRASRMRRLARTPDWRPRRPDRMEQAMACFRRQSPHAHPDYDFGVREVAHDLPDIPLPRRGNVAGFIARGAVERFFEGRGPSPELRYCLGVIL